MARLSPGSPLRQRAPLAPLQDATAQAMPTAVSSLTAGTAHEANKKSVLCEINFISGGDTHYENKQYIDVYYKINLNT